MTHLFHGIVRIIIAKLIHTKLINNEYKYKLKNNVNLEKILITHNTNKCFGMIVKLNIFLSFSMKKKKKNVI